MDIFLRMAEPRTPTTVAATPPRPPFDSAEQEAFLNLWRTYDRMKAMEEQLFGPHELTPQQYNALRLLRAAHPEPLATLELAGRLVSRSPDITRLLDKLEGRQLIARTRQQHNRRVVRVGITAAGLKLLDQLDEPVRQCHQRQFGHLSRRQLDQLTRLLKAARWPHEADQGHWRRETGRDGRRGGSA